jgi:hypothetical protein
MAMAAAFLIRTNGALLVLTLGLVHLVCYLLNHHSRKKAGEVNHYALRARVRQVAVELIPYLAFLGIVAVWKVFFPDGGASQGSLLRDITLSTLKGNLSYYLRLPSQFYYGSPFSMLVYGASIPLAVAGGLARIRRDYPFVIYGVLTFGLYIIWPGVQGLRYLFPILPFYIFFVFAGLEAFTNGTQLMENKVRRVLSFTPVIIVIAFFLVTDMRIACRNVNVHGEVAYGPFAQESQEVFSFLSTHTSPKSIIVFFKPRVMRLMTGRRSVMINKPEEVNRGDYLCLYLKMTTLDQVSERSVQSLLKRHVANLVYRNGYFAVYRLIKVGTRISDDGADKGEGSPIPHHRGKGGVHKEASIARTGSCGYSCAMVGWPLHRGRRVRGSLS